MAASTARMINARTERKAEQLLKALFGNTTHSLVPPLSICTSGRQTYNQCIRVIFEILNIIY